MGQGFTAGAVYLEVMLLTNLNFANSASSSRMQTSAILSRERGLPCLSTAEVA